MPINPTIRLSDEIKIIGYCRRQSNFIISQYSQWLFRSPQRVREAEVTVSELGLQAQLFTGLERQLIACVYNDFKSARMLGGYQILNWNHAYQTLMQALNNEAIQILCGLLPGKNSTNSLVNGFCQKAELQLKPDLIN